jgi:hypothetical protein
MLPQCIKCKEHRDDVRDVKNDLQIEPLVLNDPEIPDIDENSVSCYHLIFL